LDEVRARAAVALAPAAETDPDVHAVVVDAVHPPALILTWDDPWLTLQTVGGRTLGMASARLWEARFMVLAIGPRVEPGVGYEQLEALIPYVIDRFAADAYAWPSATLQAPRVFNIGNVPYLGARLTFQVPVTIEGGSANGRDDPATTDFG
jgi:hypothetical protein